MKALGVITDKTIPDKDKIKVLFDRLNKIFDNAVTKKDEVIAIIQEYLPEFEHIETGKSLDSKM